MKLQICLLLEDGDEKDAGFTLHTDSGDILLDAHAASAIVTVTDNEATLAAEHHSGKLAE